IPCVFVFPPRSNPPGFQSPRICFSKVEMMESRYASSSGSDFSSAIFSPSFGRCRLIKAVIKFAIESRSTASNAGRTNGSNRRSTCRRRVNVSLSESKKTEPVLARGCGRLAFEFESDMDSGSNAERTAPANELFGKLFLEFQSEINQSFLVPINLSQIRRGRDAPNFIPNPMRQERRLGIIEDDAFLVIQPTWRLVDFGDDRAKAERQNLVSQQAFLGIENFALPREMVDKLGDVLGVSGARSDDGGAFRFAVRNVARRAIGKELVKLSLRHFQQIWNGYSHGCSVSCLLRLGRWGDEIVRAFSDIRSAPACRRREALFRSSDRGLRSGPGIY